MRTKEFYGPGQKSRVSLMTRHHLGALSRSARECWLNIQAINVIIVSLSLSTFVSFVWPSLNFQWTLLYPFVPFLMLFLILFGPLSPTAIRDHKTNSSLSKISRLSSKLLLLLFVELIPILANIFRTIPQKIRFSLRRASFVYLYARKCNATTLARTRVQPTIPLVFNHCSGALDFRKRLSSFAKRRVECVEFSGGPYWDEEK